MASEAEIAWAAGLFEGEGCFDGNGGHAFRPRATMGITDEDVLRRFVAIVGVGTIGDIAPRKPHHKPAWQWWTTEAEFHAVYALLRPWLGARRIAQAEQAIANRQAHVARRTAARECETCRKVFTPRFDHTRMMKHCSATCSTKSKNARYRSRYAARKASGLTLQTPSANL